VSERGYDVVIVGGGPVGAAVAIALQDSGLTTLVLEARADAGNSTDVRTLAMSHGSRMILERLGVWSKIEPVTPIEAIHVSQRGGFGRTLLSAREAGLPALGYVVRYADLQQVFATALQSERTTLLTGADVTAMECDSTAVTIGFRQRGEPRSVAARLLIVADGGASAVLRAGTTVRTREYGQEAVVGLVTTSLPHNRMAYERFTPAGPVALLPFENRYALVWTATPETADRLMAAEADGFLRELQCHFGDRAGRFTSIEARARFALTLRYVTDPVLPRAVMLGNAAQALHPIAGQGFNLGLRDAWELADTLVKNATPDPGSTACLSAYQAARRPDRLRAIALTHSLVRIFSNDMAPLRIARGTALSLLDLVPPARRVFMRRMIFGA
jgi:2-octaprenyl-6-methoxyphenol hydroxylase